MRGSPEGVRIDPVPDKLDPKPRNDVLEGKAELEHDVDRRLVLRERKRGDLREVQDLEAMAQTRGGGLRRESSSPPVSTQRVDQLDAVWRFGRDEPGVAHELVRSLLENRPHAEATGLPALNLRRESFDGILPRDRLSDGQVPRDRGIAEDLTVPCIEIAHVKWPEPQSLSLDLGHLVSMAVRLRPLDLPRQPTFQAGLDVASGGRYSVSWSRLKGTIRKSDGLHPELRLTVDVVDVAGDPSGSTTDSADAN
jgi:hypothetical protein